MPNLTGLFYDVTKTCKTSHYIETGTYLGNGIRCVLHNYEHIHSIELSEKWYNHNVEQLSFQAKFFTNISCGYCMCCIIKDFLFNLVTHISTICNVCNVWHQ